MTVTINSKTDGGTIDDMHGTGEWHLEKLGDDVAYFGTENGETYQFRIHCAEGELVIEPYEDTKERLD